MLHISEFRLEVMLFAYLKDFSHVSYFWLEDIDSMYSSQCLPTYISGHEPKLEFKTSALGIIKDALSLSVGSPRLF